VIALKKTPLFLRRERVRVRAIIKASMLNSEYARLIVPVTNISLETELFS